VCVYVPVTVQVTIPENGQSFALIYSVEDPSNPSAATAGVGVQVSAGQQPAGTRASVIVACVHMIPLGSG
jgi:hypothetical protein